MTEQGTKRGRAYLSWFDGRDRYRWRRDADEIDLHLDTIIDGIVRLDGAETDYLIVGLRAYRTKFPGDRPRRFARTVRIDSDSGEVVDLPSFAPGRSRDAVLLLKGPTPDSGKFRHHVFAKYWLQYHPSDGLLMLEAIPGIEANREAAGVAEWRHGTWELQKSWASSMVVDHW
jgi:hypothetical protein